MNPSDYYNRVRSALDRIDAVITRPFVHVLVHAHMRAGNYAYHFNNYRDALIRLSSERANAHFVDVGSPFYGAGVPRNDDFRFLASDRVHLTPAGHNFFYKIMAEELTSMPAIPFPFTVTHQPGVMASDSFNSPNYTEVSGRTLDNALGGYLGLKWEGATKQMCAYNQRLCRLASATANFATVSRMWTPDYELAATVQVLPQGADLFFALRRASPAMSPAPNDYRLVLTPQGTISVIRRVSGVTTTLASSSVVVNPGDRLAFRAIGGQLTVLIDGETVIQTSDTAITTPGYAGFSGFGTTHKLELEDIVFTSF